MKLRIHFDLDTHGMGAFDARHVGDVSASLSNLTQGLASLKTHSQKRITTVLEDYKDQPALRDGLVRHLKQEIRLFDQIFNNFSVEGVLADGDYFVFTHQEPGYKEDLKFFPPFAHTPGRGSTFVVLLPGQKLRIMDVYGAHQILQIDDGYQTFYYRKAINHHPEEQKHPIGDLGLHFESYVAFVKETEWCQGWLTALEAVNDRHPWLGPIRRDDPFDVRTAVPGQRLINRQGIQATVVETTPDDPEYFARLKDEDGEIFAALSSNEGEWKPDPAPNAAV